MYHSFVDQYLPCQKERVAPLFLVAKAEDYLTKEFVYHIFCSTRGSRFAITNYGGRRGRKGDICLLKSSSSKRFVIYGLIEVKHLRNLGRLGIGDARDEIRTGLKDLAAQIESLKGHTLGEYPVEPSSPRGRRYGLVFASHVTDKLQDHNGSTEFYEDIRKKAGEWFRYYDHHDRPKPQLDSVFDDFRVDLMGKTFFVSLQTGLWVGK